MDFDKKYLYEVKTPIGNLSSAFTEKGLSFLAFRDSKNFDYHIKKVREIYKRELVEIDRCKITKKLEIEILEYFDGERKTFDIPLDIRGTDFQVKVWKNLIKIPYGKVISYSQLALMVGGIRYSRAVAGANGKNRILILIPCHRVIYKSGKSGGFGAGIWRKEFLLNIEKKNIHWIL